MTLRAILALLLEVVLLVLKYRYDPERLKRELIRRIDDENEKLRQTFRRAVAERDADAASRMLSRVRDRLARTRGRGLHDGDGLPESERPDRPPRSE